MESLDKTIMLFYYPTLSLLNFSLKLRRFFTLFPDFLRTTPTGSRTSRTLASRSSWESSRMNWMSCGSKCRFSACTNVTTSSVTSGSGADSLTETTFVGINTCIEKKSQIQQLIRQKQFSPTTIMDKSPWDSILQYSYFSVISWFPHKTCNRIQSWNSGKNSGYIRPTLFVEWGEGLDLCELENVPEMQKCPKTFVHDCRL